MSITPAMWLFVVTGRSRGDVDAILHSDAARAFALNAPAESWASHGVEHPLGADFSGAQDFLPQSLDEPTALSHARKVPVSLLKASLLNGTPEEVIEQAAEWRDHGVRYLVAANVSILQPSLRKGMAAGVPFFKILRGLKRL